MPKKWTVGLVAGALALALQGVAGALAVMNALRDLLSRPNQDTPFQVWCFAIVVWLVGAGGTLRSLWREGFAGAWFPALLVVSNAASFGFVANELWFKTWNRQVRYQQTVATLEVPEPGRPPCAAHFNGDALRARWEPERLEPRLTGQVVCVTVPTQAVSASASAAVVEERATPRSERLREWLRTAIGLEPGGGHRPNVIGRYAGLAASSGTMALKLELYVRPELEPREAGGATFQCRVQGTTFTEEMKTLGINAEGVIRLLGCTRAPFEPDQYVPEPVEGSSGPSGLEAKRSGTEPPQAPPQPLARFEDVQPGDFVEYALSTQTSDEALHSSASVKVRLALQQHTATASVVLLTFAPLDDAPLHPIFARPMRLELKAEKPTAGAKTTRVVRDLSPNGNGCEEAGAEWKCDCQQFKANPSGVPGGESCFAASSLSVRLGSGLLHEERVSSVSVQSARSSLRLTAFGHAPVPDLEPPLESTRWDQLDAIEGSLQVTRVQLSSVDFRVLRERDVGWADPSRRSTEFSEYQGHVSWASHHREELEPLEYVMQLLQQAATTPGAADGPGGQLTVNGRPVAAVVLKQGRGEYWYAANPWALVGAPREVRFRPLKSKVEQGFTTEVNWR